MTDGFLEKEILWGGYLFWLFCLFVSFPIWDSCVFMEHQKCRFCHGLAWIGNQWDVQNGWTQITHYASFWFKLWWKLRSKGWDGEVECALIFPFFKRFLSLYLTFNTYKGILSLLWEIYLMNTIMYSVLGAESVLKEFFLLLKGKKSVENATLFTVYQCESAGLNVHWSTDKP